jgi:hypothetical protein
MRPIGLLLAACLCAILLYDRGASPVPSLLAAAPASTPPAAPRRETRLEKLEHYGLACEILAKEKAVTEYLESKREETMHNLTVAIASQRATKEVQARWKRYGHQELEFAREQEINRLPPEKQAAAREEDDKNGKIIGQILTTYRQELKDPNSAAAKDFEKRFEESDWSKQLRFDKELVRRLTRERDETRAALLED